MPVKSTRLTGQISKTGIAKKNRPRCRRRLKSLVDKTGLLQLSAGWGIGRSSPCLLAAGLLGLWPGAGLIPAGDKPEEAVTGNAGHIAYVGRQLRRFNGTRLSSKRELH